MISNSGVSSVLKGSVHNTESTYSGPSVLSSQLDPRKTQNPSMKGSFESFSSPDVHNSNKCCVCSKGFTLKKKHLCKFCNNAVCSDHSSHTRLRPGTSEAQRICDNCEQDKAKEDIKQEIYDEFRKLQENVGGTKNTIERLNRDYFEKTSILNDAENKLATGEAIHNKTVQDLNTELEEVRKNIAKTKGLMESAKKALTGAKESELDINDRCEKAEKEIVVLEQRIVLLRKNGIEYAEKIEKSGAASKGTISFESITKSLCNRCAGRLTESYNKLKETPYWLQETEDRMTLE